MSQQLGNLPLLALTYREYAQLAQMQGDYANLTAFAQQSVDFAKQTEHLLTKLVCYKLLALAAVHNNQYSKAYDIYFDVYQSLEALQNRYLQAKIAEDFGNTLLEEHQYSLALNEFQRALDCQAALQTPKIHYTYLKLGYLWYAVGALEEAQKLFTQAATFFQTDYHPVWQIAAQRGLGLLQQQAGNPIAANQHLTTALTLAQAQQNVHLEYQLLIDQGELLLTLDNIPEAAERYDKALLLCARLGDTARIGDVQAALAKLYLMQQDRAAAQRAVELTLAALAQQRLLAAWYPFRAYWYCYQVLQALDDPRAIALLNQAYDQLQGVAQHIQQPELRHSFLYHVPANRAIISAVDDGANGAQDHPGLAAEKRTFLPHQGLRKPTVVGA